jgi:hypothetical protein
MNDLPPDPERLHTILRYLDQQITDHETISIYLRLQRDAVLEALAKADNPAPTGRPAVARQPAPANPGAFVSRESTGFCVERQPRAAGSEPVRIHVDDCASAVSPRSITAQDARAALLDPQVVACVFCRPDQELGMGID